MVRRSSTDRQPFEVVFYPRASTPEFCVKTSMVVETEDASRITCVDPAPISTRRWSSANLDSEETEGDMVEKIIEWMEMMVRKIIEEIK
ncbi:hypothetical protein Ddye_021798 [Dipteronia dyeriana]|uniref:Uncharacterized protein n=1 Tax=Dipteronia dyeriana TaxID=168575 RepID=A0AAD9U2X7_9ROSI|nr:hypothetical protein Ddye_021798 [Dipteronia dyeriana]